MICPGCKKQIPKDTINCPHCNTKIGTICKHCHSYNLIYNKACTECGTELIKFCPKCKSANFPNAPRCRKCGYSFKKSIKSTNNTKKMNTPNDIIVPPRQFVLPAITQQSEKREIPSKNINPHKQSALLKINDGLSKQHILNDDLDGPLTPMKDILFNKKQILPKTQQKKKITDNSRTNQLNKKPAKVSKKKSANEDVLQIQLNTLQNQLGVLQKQLNILPQQLNSMKMQPNPQIKEESEVIDNKPKSNQQSVLPKTNKPIQKNRGIRQPAKQITPYKTTNTRPKGVLPLKGNILPNRKNVIPKGHGILPKINKFTDIAKTFNMQAPKVESSQPAKPVIRDENKNSFEYAPNLFTQQSAKNILVSTLLNTNVNIISLSGQSGIGKNIVLRASIEELKENQFVWLIGKATPLSQITSCGLFQDILLTFFNVPNFCINTNRLKKDSVRFFKTEFPTLTHDEVGDLINFLYPETPSYYEKIFINKSKTFTMLRKVFDTISSRMQAVFVFDNFEHIDKMSYDFLKTLIHAETGLTNAKFILTYAEPKSARTYLYDKTLSEGSYADISLVPFNDSQSDTFINQYNPLFVGTAQSLRDKIHSQTGGNPAYIEQILNLITDSSRNYISFSLPNSFDGVVKRRLDILKQENILVYELLIAAATLGLKFYPVVLNQLFKVDDKTFVELFSSLLHLNFITPVNESAYEFKSTMLWKSVLEIAKRDKNFFTVNEKLFVILSGFTLSSHPSLALIATNLKQNLSALNIWSDVVRLTAEIGDENIYVLAQKHSLALVDKLQGVNSSLIKNNIYERLGKILSFSNAKEAIVYLPKVIEHVRRLEDNLKEFELTGYLAKCCHDVGNHFGVIECVDNAVTNVDANFDLEIAMLKSRKLSSILTIGNCGESVEIIDNEILPILEQNLDTTRAHRNVSIEDLFETWLQTYLVLANTLVLQGDNRSFGIISTIFEIIEKNHINNELFICKTKLTLAFANTIKGDIKESELILDETLKLYKNNDVMDNATITTWNLISVVNSILRNRYEGLQDELFQVVTFVNNNNDTLSKNVLKLFLGKVLKEKGKFKQSLSIYSEQVQHFATEKNALGVLLSWYLISEVTLLTEGPKKSLEYSLKALDIAQSPKIQNFYFITKFNKIIGEAYLANQDYDSAKVYIESAIGIARQFDLLDLLSELYFLYGKYLQELATIKSETQKDYATSSFRMYDKAVNLAQSLHNSILVNTVMTANTELRRYCHQNGIQIR